jgi:hypothetical protein
MANTLLRGARVFSNETENNASVQQEMKTNINIKLKPTQQTTTQQQQPSPIGPPYPGPPSYPSIQPQDPVNFTTPAPDEYPQQARSPLLTSEPYQYQSPAYNQLQPVNRSVDIGTSGKIDELENKLKVLESLLAIYEGQPVIVKGCLIVSQKKLISIVQLLTGADDVELLTDEIDLGCCGSSKIGFVTVNKIFVVFNHNRTEFKVSHNAEYSLLLRHGLNLKLIRVE